MKRISSINRKWYIYISIWVFYAQIHCLWHREASLGVSYKGRKTLIRQVLLCKQSISLNDPIVASAKFFFLRRSYQNTASQSVKNPYYTSSVCPADGGCERHIPGKRAGDKQGCWWVTSDEPPYRGQISQVHAVYSKSRDVWQLHESSETVSSRCWISDFTATQDHTTKCNRSCGNLPEDSV